MLKNYGLPKKLAKVLLNQVQNGLAITGRLAGLIDFPVPPNSSIRKTGGNNIRSYYLRGLHTCLPITACAIREGVRLDQKIRILDFGCGVGAQLLHFTRNYPAPLFHACDVDDTSVAFIRKAYPQVQAAVNRFDPPLPYEAANFDFIYSVSIFSHLDPQAQTLWLRELARVTRPQGWCFLTTVGFPMLKRTVAGLREDEAAVRMAVEREGFFYKEYHDLWENVRRQDTLRVASINVGIERTYGGIILHPDFIRRHWPAAGFEVRAIVEGVVHGQDLVMLRRNAS